MSNDIQYMDGVNSESLQYSSLNYPIKSRLTSHVHHLSVSDTQDILTISVTGVLADEDKFSARRKNPQKHHTLAPAALSQHYKCVDHDTLTANLA